VEEGTFNMARRLVLSLATGRRQGSGLVG